MKIGKYVASALIGLGLFGCASLPINIQNYRQKANIVEEGFHYVFGLPFYGKYYSLDKEPDAEIGELYLIDNIDGEPIIYGFDMDDSGVFDEDEMFFDEEMDGWNGNEVRFDQLENEGQTA